MTESSLLKKFLIEYSASGHRLWRMQSGVFWNGKSKRFNEKQTVMVNKGDVVIRKARRIRVGFEGLSDTLGFTQVTITKDMVGRTIAVFTACEIKTPNVKATKKQQNFIRMVNEKGGIAVIARKLEHIFEAVNKFMEGNHETKH